MRTMKLGEALEKFRKEKAAGRKSLPQALAELRDADPETRRWGVLALRRIGGKEAVQALIGALEDPDPWVRSSAALSLGILEAPAAFEPLLRHYRGDPSGEVRAMCGPYLEQYSDPRVIPAHLDALRDPEWKVVLGAVVALELLEVREAVPNLFTLLDHPTASVRRAACEALLTFGVPDSRIASTLEALDADPEAP